jgi:PAS domain S-box-containing protein
MAPYLPEGSLPSDANSGAATPTTSRPSVSHDHLRAVFDAMSEGLVIHGRNGQILEANRAAEKTLGLSRDQILGRTSMDPQWQAIHEDGTPFLGETHPAVLTLQTGKPVHDQTMGIRVAGQPERWLSINTQPILEDGDPAPSGVVATFVDITERRRILQELRQARADLAAILDNVPARVTAWNLDYTNRFANRHAERAWGLPEGGAVGKSTAEILGPERHARALPYIQAALAGVTQSHEQIDPQPDGTSKHSLVTYVPKLRDGQVMGVYALGVDVTSLREVQDALNSTIVDLRSATASLRESEHRFRTVANGVPMAIALFDMNEKIVFANDEIMKLAPDVRVVEGRLASEFFPPDLYARGQAARIRAMQGETVRFEVSALRNGEHRSREVTYAPYRGPGGHIEGVFALGYDVTEIQQSRERIRELVQRLASVREGEKVAISATLHEGIAQELFAAQLALQQLAKGVATADTVQALAAEVSAALQQTVGKLRQVTNELVPTSLSNLPLPTTLRIYAEDFASRHELTLRYEVIGRIPDVSTDIRLLLFRTLQQGLANAQEHSNSTTVTVTLKVTVETLGLTIADNGRGLPVESTQKSGSHGVLMLTERYRALGGDVDLRRGDREGVVLIAQLPVAALSGSPVTTARALT